MRHRAGRPPFPQRSKPPARRWPLPPVQSRWRGPPAPQLPADTTYDLDVLAASLRTASPNSACHTSTISCCTTSRSAASKKLAPGSGGGNGPARSSASAFGRRRPHQGWSFSPADLLAGPSSGPVSGPLLNLPQNGAASVHRPFAIFIPAPARRTDDGIAPCPIC